jgi:1,2-diacylglycerol 3-alpha-glucosyltransferase
MNILMMTNTYLPYIGGVERSVELFASEYRRCGHKVLIVAPTYRDINVDETNVIRVPSLQKFNGTDFSLQLPIPGFLTSALKAFQPEIVHSHHPFMIGDSALRIAAQFRIPIVYTFHTYYESYTHYVPGDSAALKRFVIALATGYANLCDHVFAPSNCVALDLKKRGVETFIDVVPTGIEIKNFSKGDRKRFRLLFKIPHDAFVIGFVSRIAPEKNMAFLAKAVGEFLSLYHSVHFLMIGIGPSADEICNYFISQSLEERFHFAGVLTAQELIDAYHSMDVFVFASKTETQGLVLTEAMASGLPVVALDGPAINEVVKDCVNGRLIFEESINEFCNALEWCLHLKQNQLKKIQKQAVLSVEAFSKEVCAKKALSIYESLMSSDCKERDQNDNSWAKAIRLIKAEFDLIKNVTKATGAAINDTKNNSD